MQNSFEKNQNFELTNKNIERARLLQNKKQNTFIVEIL